MYWIAPALIGGLKVLLLLCEELAPRPPVVPVPPPLLPGGRPGPRPVVPDPAIPPLKLVSEVGSTFNALSSLTKLPLAPRARVWEFLPNLPLLVDLRPFLLLLLFEVISVTPQLVEEAALLGAVPVPVSVPPPPYADAMLCAVSLSVPISILLPLCPV